MSIVKLIKNCIQKDNSKISEVGVNTIALDVLILSMIVMLLPLLMFPVINNIVGDVVILLSLGCLSVSLLGICFDIFSKDD